ncbi:hypothetical protein K493DRAFT_64167 [Basidiobolus meristosporus CBS 931.73]|uniref:Uncharacterized protein n=1 Tax=Basidiobolus meristosporus CBS 931.73 TaxID=1314790 RepID=A0A1Y1XVU9_9FUNG|nr:hypothetical protein K493DRAFT_64167 [Basidiobolus meristosporus CBS 931.73]|eukprot:ORX89880.1 hypothetical protein K493DRAFT_64167 [Basidiobolus meristosporus CBS 931.73]
MPPRLCSMVLVKLPYAIGLDTGCGHNRHLTAVVPSLLASDAKSPRTELEFVSVRRCHHTICINKQTLVSPINPRISLIKSIKRAMENAADTIMNLISPT